MSPKPRVSIEYCPRCGWLLRAAWLAQELLTTFERELGGLELVPSAVSGTFEVRVDGVVVWNRQADHGFPQAADLKRRVRDRVAPGRTLGHSERGRSEAAESPAVPAEEGAASHAGAPSSSERSEAEP
jgi:selenoprotein W-related protein